MDLFQIHTKYSLGSGLKRSTFSPCIDQDPKTFLSLISTKRPGPKGPGWNMTYAADVVVVVLGYTIDSCVIQHY